MSGIKLLSSLALVRSVLSRGLIATVFLLCGTIVWAGIIASPAHVNFGRVALNGSSYSFVTTVQNQGLEPVSIFVTSNCGLEFSWSSGCGYLNPYQSCTVWTQFNPRSEGFKSCSLNVRASPSGFTNIWLSGEGFVP